MLMIEVFPVFGEAYRRVSLLVERGVIAAAQVTVEPEDEQRLYPGVVRRANLSDVASQFPGRRVAFAAEGADLLELLVIGGDGHALGKHAHHGRILSEVLVTAHNVIVTTP
jgi:hypothetical protein